MDGLRPYFSTLSIGTDAIIGRQIEHYYLLWSRFSGHYNRVTSTLFVQIWEYQQYRPKIDNIRRYYTLDPNGSFSVSDSDMPIQNSGARENSNLGLGVRVIQFLIESNV